MPLKTPFHAYVVSAYQHYVTHKGIHSEYVTVVLLRFGIFRYVCQHSSVLWILRDVRYVLHIVVADHNLEQTDNSVLYFAISVYK